MRSSIRMREPSMEYSRRTSAPSLDASARSSCVLDGRSKTWNAAARCTAASCAAGDGPDVWMTAAAMSAAANMISSYSKALERFRTGRRGARFDRGLRSAQLLHFMACHEVVAVIQELGHFDLATFVRYRASRMEPAAARRPHRRRDVAFEDDALAPRFRAWVGDRDRRQQRLRVGMERPLVERVAIGQLHDLADV